MKPEDVVIPQATGSLALQTLKPYLAEFAESIAHPAWNHPIPFDLARHALHGILVPGLAHELNNRLTSVIGYSQFALRGNDGVLCAEEMASIEKESRRAAFLVRSILDLNRPSSNRMLEGILLGDLLSSIERLAGATLRKMDIILATNAGEPLPAVHGDFWTSLEGIIALLLGCSPLLPQRSQIQLLGCSKDLATAIRLQIEVNPGTIRPEIKKPKSDKSIKESDSRWLFALASQLLRVAGMQIYLSDWDENPGTLDITWQGSQRDEEKIPENRRTTSPKAMITEAADEDVTALVSMLKSDGFQVYVVRDHESAVKVASQEDCQLLFINLGARTAIAESAFQKIRSDQPALADRVVFTSGQDRTEECRQIAGAYGRPHVTLPCDPGTIHRLTRDIHP